MGTPVYIDYTVCIVFRSFGQVPGYTSRSAYSSSVGQGIHTLNVQSGTGKEFFDG